jgi:hypothetical protein
MAEPSPLLDDRVSGEFESIVGPQKHEGILREKVGNYVFWGATPSNFELRRRFVDSTGAGESFALIPNIRLVLSFARASGWVQESDARRR